MNQVTTLDTSSVKSLVRELEEFEQVKKRILETIPEQFLQKGSDLWWQKAALEGLKEVKVGDVKKFKSVKSALDYLHS